MITQDPPHALVPLYTEAFAADPHGHYQLLRERYGPVAPVEIAPGIHALLVLDYQVALEVLRDEDSWTRDPRRWQQTVPPDSPVLPMLAWRPTAHFSDGDVHARYRRVINDALSSVQPHTLHARVQDAARQLIRGFAAQGSADLVAQYANHLPATVLTTLFGVGEEDKGRLVAGIAGMVDSTETAAAAYADLVAVITDLVAQRRSRPRGDLTSQFVVHPTGLDNDEIVRQITLTMIAGLESTTNLIGSALLRMLSDERYAESLVAGATTAQEAIDQVLWHEAPLANLSASFPRRDLPGWHGHRVPAYSLVLVSHAAASSQAAPRPDELYGRGGEGAHLAWAAGRHACPPPGRRIAMVMAIAAIETITGLLCDMTLAVPAGELRWRPGPFHRSVRRLPVSFTPIAA